jgi:hypothetical protein
MTPAFLRAATLALCLAASSAFAEARCISRHQVSSAIAQQLPGAQTALLASEEAQAFLAAYNATPPHTALAADEILLVELPDEPMITRAILFTRGCLAQAGAMPRRLVKSLLISIEGSKI